MLLESGQDSTARIRVIYLLSSHLASVLSPIIFGILGNYFSFSNLIGFLLLLRTSNLIDWRDV